MPSWKLRPLNSRMTNEQKWKRMVKFVIKQGHDNWLPKWFKRIQYGPWL